MKNLKLTSLIAAGALAASAGTLIAEEKLDPDVVNKSVYKWVWDLVQIKKAWEAGYTGAGVNIAVIDRFVDWKAPTIAGNYNAELSQDLIEGGYKYDENTDPSKLYISAAHGTFVASLAAGNYTNTEDGTFFKGMACNADIVGLNIGEGTDGSGLDEKAILKAYQIVSGAEVQKSGDSYTYVYQSETPTKVANCSFGSSDRFLKPNTDTDVYRQIHAGTLNGQIFVYAAGNSRYKDGQTNAGSGEDFYTGFSTGTSTAFVDTIQVAAVKNTGEYAWFSCYGSNIFVSAPGEDVAGQYRSKTGASVTYKFASSSGTSFAAPIVSGIIALAAQNNEALDNRWAKHAIAKTSIYNDAMKTSEDGNTSYITNSAGLTFSNDYGFGLIQAKNFVDYSKAIAYETVEQKQSFSLTPTTGIPGTITKTILKSGKIETVSLNLSLGISYLDFYTKLTVTIEHGEDVSVILEPTKNAKATPGTTQTTIPWNYVSNAFWGTDLTGDWTVNFNYSGSGEFSISGTPTLDFTLGHVVLEEDVTTLDGIGTAQSFVWDTNSTIALSKRETLYLNNELIVNAGTIQIAGTLDHYSGDELQGRELKVQINEGATLELAGTLIAKRGIEVNGGTFLIDNDGTFEGNISTSNGGKIIFGNADDGTPDNVELTCAAEILIKKIEKLENNTISVALGEILAAWAFDITKEPEESVSVAMQIADAGTTINKSDIRIWHSNNNIDWEDYTAAVEITGYDSETGTLTFDAKDFSSYAVSLIPEPALFGVFPGIAAALLAGTRRKRKK